MVCRGFLNAICDDLCNEYTFVHDCYIPLLTNTTVIIMRIPLLSRSICGGLS